MAAARDVLARLDDLPRARDAAHAAAQLLMRAAATNIPVREDYSHTALTWLPPNRQFVTGPMGDKNVRVALALSPLSLIVSLGQGLQVTHMLAGTTPHAALGWLDARLAANGLTPASHVEGSSDLPEGVAGLTTFERDLDMASLAAWYDLASGALSTLANAQSALRPGPSPVRTWPHHFDIATYVALADGDAEDAPGIGVGMAPGDAAYPDPYFYVNPWPMPAPDALPQAPSPGHWHVEGFVGAVATAPELLGLADISGGTDAFLDAAFSAGIRLLGHPAAGAER
ncbi:MAG: hypothetical protein AAFU80_22050 [Pseudomonadota bacterium]